MTFRKEQLMNLNRALFNAKMFTKRNSSTILVIAGGIGFVSTIYSTYKATHKSDLYLQELERYRIDSGEEPLTKKEKIFNGARFFIPTAILGISTIACFGIANVIDRRARASLISACTLLNTKYNDFKLKTEEMYGEASVEKIKREIAIDGAMERKELLEAEREIHHGEKEWFRDEYSGRWFQAYYHEVLEARYEFHKMFSHCGKITPNVFYQYLENADCPPKPEYDAVGWSDEAGAYFYGYVWVDIEITKVESEDNDPDFRPFYNISFPKEPTTDFLAWPPE